MLTIAGMNAIRRPEGVFTTELSDRNRRLEFLL